MKHIAWAAILASVTSLLPVSAQQVYRIVGPDGRISFSDQPPADSQARASTTSVPKPGTSGTPLPFELRQATSRFPVTLYTGTNCTPCDQGRALLVQRGIPFAERTVTTPEDGEALRRLSGDVSLPLLTVGNQQIRGFAPAQWGQYLDAAGYPALSVLPAGFQHASAGPMVSVQPATDAPVSTAPAPTPRPSAVPRRSTRPATGGIDGRNPAGIQF